LTLSNFNIILKKKIKLRKKIIPKRVFSIILEVRCDLLRCLMVTGTLTFSSSIWFKILGRGRRSQRNTGL